MNCVYVVVIVVDGEILGVNQKLVELLKGVLAAVLQGWGNK